MSNLFTMTVAGSVIVELLLMLRPVTTKFFSARWQYQIGKMAIIFFLLPFSFFIGKLYAVVPQTFTLSHSSGTSTTDIPKELPLNVLGDTMDSLMTWHFYCYCRFMKQIHADSIPAPENANILLIACKLSLGIVNEVKLMQNSKVVSTMLVGLHHPIILLPTSNMQEINLRLILIHELTHLKQKDLWVKMLALAAKTLHWFNPFVYILCGEINIWSELSCDELLATKMSLGERKIYGETILNTLDLHSTMNTAFCSSLSKIKNHIERRLTMLLNAKKTKKHIAIFSVAATLIIGGTGMVFAAGMADAADNNVVNEIVEGTESEEIRGIAREFTESKQIVNVDIENLDSGEFVSLGEYTLEEGDWLLFNLAAEGEGSLDVCFYKTNSPSDRNGYLGYADSGNFIEEYYFTEVEARFAGTYYL